MAMTGGHDVLFIHPGNQRRNYQDLSTEFTAIATPSWTVLLASALVTRGYSAAIYDVNVQGWDEAVAGELLERYRPSLVVLMVYGHNPSASTQTMPAARAIASDLKRSSDSTIPIAFGGTHPSAVPQRTLAEEPIDYVIQGEGLYTLLDFMLFIRGEVGQEEVRGLWLRRDAGTMANPPAPLIQDLDGELGSYRWELLPGLNSYRAHNMHCFQYFSRSGSADFSDVRSPYVALNTSLGCPFSCSYCCINAVFGKPGIRYWSVERVVSWIDELVRQHQVKNIRFDDELFLLSSTRVEAFCDLLIARDYDLNIWVYGRADTIDAALLAKIRRAGITWICLGIESGNERVRRDVNKNIAGDIKATVAAIQAAGIHVLGNYMFGLPEDTLETMQQTLDLALELNTEYANFYCVMAYPGSRLYHEALLQEGALPEGWEGYSQYGYNARPLPSRHLTPAQIVRFRDEAFKIYHTAPAYLKMIRETFGDRVITHVSRMLEVPIRRRLLEKSENFRGTL